MSTNAVTIRTASLPRRPLRRVGGMKTAAPGAPRRRFLQRAAVGGAAGGVAGGMAAGAAIGGMTGPVGAVVGAVAGAAVGAMAGRGVAKAADPDVEETYWRDNYTGRPYVASGQTYDDYGPAYRYGAEAYNRHPGRR